MITLPTVLIGALAVGLTAVPAGLSLFSKNNKLKKIASIVSIIGFTGLAALLTLPSVSFTLKSTQIAFNSFGGWFSKPFSLWLGNLKDYILNALMLAPLGVGSVAHTKANNKKHPILKAMLLGLGVSLGIEFCQFMLPVNRFPALNDVLFNTLSAGIGASCLIGIHKVKDWFKARKEKKLQSKLEKEKFKNKEKIKEKELLNEDEIIYSSLEVNTPKLETNLPKPEFQTANENYIEEVK